MVLARPKKPKFVIISSTRAPLKTARQNIYELFVFREFARESANVT